MLFGGRLLQVVDPTSLQWYLSSPHTTNNYSIAPHAHNGSLLPPLPCERLCCKIVDFAPFTTFHLHHGSLLVFLLPPQRIPFSSFLHPSLFIIPSFLNFVVQGRGRRSLVLLPTIVQCCDYSHEDWNNKLHSNMSYCIINHAICNYFPRSLVVENIVG